MDHVLKYKVGDKVRIVADMFDSHGEELGSEHVVVYTELESRKLPIASSHQEYFLSSGSWVTETDIAPAETKCPHCGNVINF